MQSFFNNWLYNTWWIITESAAYLILGFILAGLIHVFLPKKWIERQLSIPGSSSILKATLFGLPLPLCSCSVIPVAVSLRRAGASRGATASFLVSTPEIGADSFALSLALLGLPLTILRTLAAFISAFITGILVDRSAVEEAAPEASPKTACCENELLPPKGIKEAFKFGLRDLPRDLAPLLLLGFALAGLAASIIPDNYISTLQLSSQLMIPLMLILSLPVYVCAASMTPLAAVLLAKGVSAGGVLVFLLAGPASNFATMLAIKKELGKNSLINYLIAVIGTTLAFGFITDFFFSDIVNFSYLEQTLTQEHHSGTSASKHLLASLLLLGLLQKFLVDGLSWSLGSRES